MNDHTAQLPREIKDQIVSYLPPRATCRTAQVSKDWRESADDPLHWRRLYEDRFGAVPGPLVPDKRTYEHAHQDAVKQKRSENLSAQARYHQRNTDRYYQLTGGAVATALGMGGSLATGKLYSLIAERGLRASIALGRRIPMFAPSPWQLQLGAGYGILVDAGCKLAAGAMAATALWQGILLGGRWLDDRASAQRADQALTEERSQVDWS